MHGAKILGHSVHPILIVFPLGLLAMSVVFDFIHVMGASSMFAVVSCWMIVSGLIGGVLAALFGWIDWFSIPHDTRAKGIGLAHGIVNTIVLLLYLGSWYSRYNDPSRPEILATIFSTLGAGVALVGGWLGGELVEHLGEYESDAPSLLKVSRADIQIVRRKELSNVH